VLNIKAFEVYSNVVNSHRNWFFIFISKLSGFSAWSFIHYYQIPRLWLCWTKTCWRCNMVFEKSQQ